MDHKRNYFEENKAKEGLGQQSLRSGVISVVARGVNVFVQVGSTIYLARLLTPHDYGLVAMVTAIVGFAPMLIDLGTNDASVQKAQITQTEVSALFWLNCVIGGTLAILMASCSSLIALFYHESELQAIALVSSLTFVFAALSCQHYALLRRAMRFKTIAMIDTGANLVSTCVAIVMALRGSGYWALVMKPILNALFCVVAVWWNCRWMPGIPKLTRGVKELMKFGLHITGFTMTDYAAKSADRIALGYYFGARELGFFQNAFLLYDNALSLLVTPLHTVAVTSLSKLRENLDELRRLWGIALSSLSFFAMPAFGLLAIASQDVVALLLGEKWAPAGPLLSIFALRGIAHVVERTLGWLHVAAGRSDRWMRWGVVSSVTQLAALFCGLPFGLMGVAVAYMASTFILFVPAIAYAGKPLGIGSADVIRVVGPPMASAICSTAIGYGVATWLLADAYRPVRIGVLVLVCSASYLLIASGLFRVTKPLMVAKSLLRGFVPAWSGRLGGMFSL